jgi:hypothetical protein
MGFREHYGTFYSDRQRVVVLTFQTVAEAREFDRLNEEQQIGQVMALIERLREAG